MTRIEAALMAIANDARAASYPLKRKMKIAEAACAGRCPKSWDGLTAEVYQAARHAALAHSKDPNPNGQPNQ